MGFQPEKQDQERSDMGESVFLETDPISLFLGLLIYVSLHIGMNTQSRGGQQSWPLSKSGASHKKVLGILWSFLSDNQKTYFFQECFFLNQAPPSKWSYIPIGWGCSELQSTKEFI